jgi:type IV pilus assembly protein PilM
MKDNYSLNYNNIDIEVKEKKKSVDVKSLMKLDFKTLKSKLLKKFKQINKINTPEKKRKVIAFDIGTTTIKIVEAMYYKDELNIYKCLKIPTPKGAIVDGEIKKEEELYSKLKRILKKNNINSKYATCTTNSTVIINREIQIPKVEAEEIGTVIRYEIQQYLPINLDDYILQSTFLGEEEVEGNEKINIRVIAYPEKIARGYYNFLMKLELKPYALDVNYNAINKIINVAGKNSEFENETKDTVAFIDMGASFIDVNIYKAGKLQFTRIIKDGGNDIDEILMQNKEVNSDELIDFKAKNINLNEGLDSLNIQVKEIVDDWMEKIEKIIQFYKNKNIGNDINNIIIFGGSSKIKGMESYMTEKLGIRTQIKGISKIAFKSKDEEDSDDYLNAIGSVIRLE